MKQPDSNGPNQAKPPFYAHSDPEKPGLFPDYNLFGGLSYEAL